MGPPNGSEAAAQCRERVEAPAAAEHTYSGALQTLGFYSAPVLQLLASVDATCGEGYVQPELP